MANFQPKSLLHELDMMLPEKDKHLLVESRSSHILESINRLLETIDSNFTVEESSMLERKLLNSIKHREPSKFLNAIQKLAKSK